MKLKNLIAVLSATLLLAAGMLFAAPAAPKSVIHIITVKFKPDATSAQIDAALNAAKTMNYPGLKNVWVKPIKMQFEDPAVKNIIVMEFASEEAFKSYTDSPAQKKFYEVYLPIRGESRTHDVTN